MGSQLAGWQPQSSTGSSCLWKGVEAGRGICQTAVLQWEAACRQPQTRVKSIQRVLSTLCGKQEQARTDCALQ